VILFWIIIPAARDQPDPAGSEHPLLHLAAEILISRIGHIFRAGELLRGQLDSVWPF
jgi:hypothetical protein